MLENMIENEIVAHTLHFLHTFSGIVSILERHSGGDEENAGGRHTLRSSVLYIVQRILTPKNKKYLHEALLLI